MYKAKTNTFTHKAQGKYTRQRKTHTRHMTNAQGKEKHVYTQDTRQMRKAKKELFA